LNLEFRDGWVDAGDGGRLEAAMRAELEAIYQDLDMTSAAMPAAGPAELNPPAGVFLVGYLDEQPICCGGIKRLDVEACELKRMYVVPALRGRGLARALLAALEDRARALGYRVVRLTTGPQQPASRHLYESAGYAPIENFNGDPVATYFGEKSL
jgi:GNAT superfamily N-acetyltransferase